jgi:cation:H+ antiporter
VLFSIQVGLAFSFREDEALTIRTLTWLGWIYLALTTVIVALNLDGLAQIVLRVLRPHKIVPATASERVSEARDSD